MNDLDNLPDELLDPIARIIAEALPHAPDFRPEDVMVVGAVCRDLYVTTRSDTGSRPLPMSTQTGPGVTALLYRRRIRLARD